MMIATKKPYGAVGSNSIQYRFVQDNKFYIVDSASNVWEVSENDYMKLTCPVKKFIRKVR